MATFTRRRMVEKPDGYTDGHRSLGGTDAYRATFDWADPDQPSAALVEVIARARGLDPIEVEPLHDHLDPDALNALFARESLNGRTGSVTITIDGYRVRIEGDGQVVVRPADR